MTGAPLEVVVDLPGECCLCRGGLGADPVLLPETDLPGLAVDGDPLRIVGWCRACAPAWAAARDAAR